METTLTPSEKPRRPSWALLVINLAAIGLLAAFGPTEKTLGSNMRLIYLHAAWVWSGLITFTAAGVIGLAGLALRRNPLHRWSLALGRTGLFFWLTYLPMSLLVMKMNWGGFFFDEPRWRIPLAFAVTGALLQAGLALVNKPALASVGNLVFAAALLAATLNMESVMHPDSPILTSESASIKLFFAGLLALSLLLGYQLTVLSHQLSVKNSKRLVTGTDD